VAADQPRAVWRRILAIMLIAAATLMALALLSEGVAHLLFRQSTTSTMACLVATDAGTGVRGRPNSSCQQKIFESPLVEYRFNACGFRTPQACGPAPAGTYRIVLIGSSLAYGMHATQPASFAARLGPLLSGRLDRPVDVFNQAMQWGLPASIALHTDAILAPHPDMILWTLTPFDIENAGLILPYIPGVQDTLSVGGSGGSTDAAPHPQGLASVPGRAWRKLISYLSDTRTVFMLQHALYRSQSQYMSHTLTQGHAVDYLRVPTDPALKDGLAIFAQSVDRIAARARQSGVPLVVTLLPSRPQAIMLSNRSWDSGYDPNHLGQLLRPIVEKAGGRYIDMTPGLEAMPDAGQNYFSVDEHLPPAGHEMLATLLSDALVRAKAIPGTRREGAR
jgi:hypothetical protein